MEIANCEHKEEISLGNTDGQTCGVCTICGQEREYIEGDEDSEVIIKLGRIDGAIVLPPAKTRFRITPAETRLVQEGWDIRNAQEGNRLGKEAPVTEPEPEPVEVKPLSHPPRGPDKRDLYLDEHREEILADRLAIGNGRTLTKWKITLAVWTGLVKRWRKEGLVVEDLRHASRRLSPEEAVEKISAKKTPTVREEHKKSVLSSEDKIEITVGRLEEILRELEYLRGYRRAVLDLLQRDE